MIVNLPYEQNNCFRKLIISFPQIIQSIPMDYKTLSLKF